MILKIKYLLQKVGIDGAIAYSVLAKLLQAVGGVISVFFIAKYLTKQEQGYYYTFGSILAIQIFFELGLSTIITQFVAHEKVHLQWSDNTTLIGNERALSRLASLLQFCVKWFLGIALCLVIILVIAGFIFFAKYGKDDSSVMWQIPWIILSVLTAINLMVSPIFAFFEGLGKVKDIAKIRFIQQCIQLLGTFLFLMVGFKLYASPLAAMLTAIIAPIWILFSYRKQLLRSIWYGWGEYIVNYRLEIFPYQWRIAVSWISGYFIFQLFNPVLFATEGATVAGQMGMTLAALNGVLSISLSWINTKVPLFSSLIAKKDYQILDLVFNKTILQASLICAICLGVLILGVYELQYTQHPIGNRFLPVLLVTLLASCVFVNQIVSALATYLRCHKEEPFLIISIVMGVLTACSTLILGNYFGINGIVGGYSFLTLFVSLTWAGYIFKTKREEWHQ